MQKFFASPVMKILKQKQEIEDRELTQISKAQARAFDMVKRHLAEPLKQIESMGYSRLELACAYLSLAYHSLRYGRTKEQADIDFPKLSILTCKRMEENFKQQKIKKLH